MCALWPRAPDCLRCPHHELARQNKRGDGHLDEQVALIQFAHTGGGDTNKRVNLWLVGGDVGIGSAGRKRVA